MKTLRLNRAESTAYANGERRFWRAMRKQPDRTMVAVFESRIKHKPYWDIGGFRCDSTATNPYPCPYGTPGDRIRLKATHDLLPHERTITRVEVEQRGGRWGWVVEVGA
jgi:hypothetical protein